MDKKPDPTVVNAVLTLYGMHDEQCSHIAIDGPALGQGLPRLTIVVARDPMAAREPDRWYRAFVNGHPLPTPLPVLSGRET